MTDVKDFFIASNIVRNAPDYDSKVLSSLIHTVEAFARVTYQSVYLIDYYKQEFLYVLDNPLFLCGHTAKEVKKLGYSFYLKHVPEEERKMLVELSNHFHLNSGARSKLVNQQSTPILLNDEGKIWIGMCRSLDTIKFYKRHAFEKLGVTNITEAVSRAALNKLF